MLSLEDGIKDDAGGSGSEWVPRSAPMNILLASIKPLISPKKPCFSFPAAVKQRVTHVVCTERGVQGFHINLSNGHKSEYPQTLHFIQGTGHLARPESSHGDLGAGTPRSGGAHRLPVTGHRPTWETAGMGR